VFGHILKRAAIVAIVGALLSAGAALALRRTAGQPDPGTTVASPSVPEVAGAPAELDGRVTRIATGPSAPDALAMVEHAHTAVVAAPGPDRMRAAHLAHALRAPLVIARGAADGARGGGEPAGASSAPPDARPSAGERPDAAAALRRMGVVRAVLVGDAVTDETARDGGVREIVRLHPTTRRRPTGRQLVRWAAGGRAPGQRSDPGFDDRAVQDLRATLPPPAPPTGVATLVRPSGTEAVHVALAARAVGHTVVATSAHDLRGDAQLIDRLAALSEDGEAPPVVLGGGGMVALDRRAVAAQVAVAATGVHLPGGGQLVIDPRRPHTRRYVGLYGVPQSAALGALGEQPVDASATRARRLAHAYQRAVGPEADIIGCFEIIATVASSSAGRDGNYANEPSIAELEPAVRAARRAGLYVLLDIQPGRTDFLTQAKRYRTLLRRPHVGLALDPEWRLRPGEKHLEQIGSVDIDEVNAVADWLADQTRRRRLPQKMLLIHQFRLSMVRDRERLDTSRDELAYVIQMDGQGPQGSKIGTWRAITAAPPDGVQFGWKNFYDEDTPVRSPEATMALNPPPVFVSYQ
jgi:hypothetical protein